METIDPLIAASAERYSRGAVILHWLIALLIIGNVAGAWLSEGMPKPDRAAIMALHKAFGITILLLTLVWIGWRLTHKRPPMVETLKAWEAALARVTHWLFYILMLAMPLTGWAFVSGASQGKPVSMFGLFNIPALPIGFDKATVGTFKDLHGTLGTLIVGLFVLHVLGALKHQFLDRDGTLRRMVPFLK
ncbi:MAG: cytochrome b [Pseudomonadota bacterium]|nr:cytochrome b [Pseudomonadota bacterium]